MRSITLTHCSAVRSLRMKGEACWWQKAQLSWKFFFSSSSPPKLSCDSQTLDGIAGDVLFAGHVLQHQFPRQASASRRRHSPGRGRGTCAGVLGIEADGTAGVGESA